MTHVLLVDDDPTLRTVLGQLLTDEGFQVTTAPGGYEALNEIVRHRPDVIVSDVVMPQPDGIRLLELLDGQGVDIPVVLITGQQETRRHLADAVLPKPLDADRLIETIARICD